MHLKRHFPKFHARAANSIYALRRIGLNGPCDDIACGLEFGQLSDYINATP